ncbi:hypothetical protein ACFE04_012156 [Oxalis oulophora]
MASSSVYLIMFLIAVLCDCLQAEAKVLMVLMKEEPFLSLKSRQAHISNEESLVYKELLRISHDSLLDSLLFKGSYTKLYSYTHLLNGFAVHISSKEDLNFLRNATGVRAIHEDVKMEKFTTHSPDFLGITEGVWPNLGGADSSGEGVVIGLIDTGINPTHPSFSFDNFAANASKSNNRFKGACSTGKNFPSTACNGKIIGARYFVRSAIAAGEFNPTRDYASPFDSDGHGSHTASIAAGNHRVPVMVNNFDYGYASGMAPGARIAVYKALYTFGGYMSDAVAAVDQAVEDGVDILSLSIGPSSVPPGLSAFLNVLELGLLFATKAGVLVIQAAGNGGPTPSSILSFSPWITTVAASVTDRKYNNSIRFSNGESFTGAGLAPQTAGEHALPIAAAADICIRNLTTSIVTIESCENPDFFIQPLARGRLIICTYSSRIEDEAASFTAVANTIEKVEAAGFILTMSPDISDSEQLKSTTMTFRVPGIVLNNMRASSALWEYYNSNTIRSRRGLAVVFGARARIFGGRHATYSGQAPVVASYSSRGPDVNNALLQTADVLKPNIMAPGSSIWGAWSPSSNGDPYAEGQNFALVSGTSMSAPHIAGVAALIKHKHPKWSPAAITSAMMTSADILDNSGHPILAQSTNQLASANPFDFGSGSVNPTRAINPGLIFDARFANYVKFLCAVPGVDDYSVQQALGVPCPVMQNTWCSDLNTPSVTISNLVGSRNVIRRVKNVSRMNETYTVTVKEPYGVNVTVSPMDFSIGDKETVRIRIALQATKATRAYTFGEIVLYGSRNHIVRVPIAVFISTSLS